VRDPTVLPRAIKNEAELAGHRAAQARDGAAMARFLKWVGERPPASSTS
jgi:Xaa-Pro aminopeptidase